jgi:hypothetical protein
MLYLAEFYLPGSASLAAVVERARAGALTADSAGTCVTFVRAIFVPRDESCFALYEAGSGQAVAAAGARAGLAFDRVIEAVALP